MRTRTGAASTRWARPALVGSLLAGALVAAAPPAQACACGALVDGPAYETSVDAETTLLQWDGTTQTLLLELDTVSTAPEVGLLLPTPGPAEVALADPEIFRELDDLTAPQAVVSEVRWWPELGLGGDDDGAGAGGGVDVLGTVRLGPLEVTTLAATDAAALDTWLTERGFQLPGSIRTALNPYVDAGWSYVAARVAPEEAPTFDGTLQPLRVTFDTPSLVQPMRLAALADGTQRLRTYVLADQRMARDDPSAEVAPPSLRFAGRVDPADVSTAELAELLAAGSYVTAYDQTLTEPGEQVVSEFTYAPAGDDTTFTASYAVVADKRIGPFFAGPVLAFAGVLALSVLVVWAARRRRAPAPLRVTRPARA
ncbi:DUF2330 domain-containing protein [Cellulosimicrobium marinum]|uniref:DUF2330 domain-containing protein n=1 Tax=Cellulosimicrobium marinum TaxID=1638992 RepID=UPI001E57CF65|nr:DUF2330 domain-containing protein [Cellulosimicrobium marinum]MCB7135662.1 DUF2330 domain-containing protein [Cellulosimicrobium marinum]